MASETNPENAISATLVPNGNEPATAGQPGAHRPIDERGIAGRERPEVRLREIVEGIAVLVPLTRSENEIIREGAPAMLAQRLEQAEARARQRQQQGWTTYQFSDRLVLDRLRAASESWAEFKDPQRREDALQRFHEYAYQWY